MIIIKAEVAQLPRSFQSSHSYAHDKPVNHEVTFIRKELQRN